MIYHLQLHLLLLFCFGIKTNDLQTLNSRDEYKSIGENGIINQTLLKTNGKYGFDSLLFSVDVLTLFTGYINYIRPRLNLACNYLLVCRNGKQISKLTNIFGRVVYEAIGKYINPTRYRQIIETESIEKLNTF